MDGLSIAASIVGIATSGVQLSIKLVTLATQISTASDRVSSIGNDISLTSGVLHQLGGLMSQKTTDGNISILNQHGLETTKTSASICERIFQEIEREVKRASAQLRYKPGRGRMNGEKIELTTIEKAKWPFLQPNIDRLRADLRDAKSTLMLMLQVATLALSKRIAEASLSTSEHQDFVRAIVALELQRREEQRDSTEQQEGSRSFRSNGTPKIENANTVSSGEGTLNPDHNSQPSSSPAQADRKHTAGVNESCKNSSDTRAKSLLDPIVGSGGGQSRGLENQNVMNVPLPSPRYSNQRWTDENSKLPDNHIIGSSHVLVPSDSDSRTQTNHNTELQLFLLKPMVIDFSDKIELHWSMQNANMQQFAIHEHMAKAQKDPLPSVLEMLLQLHAYEQRMVDSETSKGSGGSVLFLKRTRTDIQCRDMLFEAVPGLQFVVQRDTRQPSFSDYSVSSPLPSHLPPQSKHQEIPKSRHNGRKTVSKSLKKKKTEEEGVSKHSSPPSFGPLAQYFPSSHVPRANASDGDTYHSAMPELPPEQSMMAPLDQDGQRPMPPRMSFLLPVSSSEDEEDYQWTAGGYVDSQEDKDAEALVTKLLAKYTVVSA